MEIEKQVCSLEQAKELKALDFIQESLWYWQKNLNDKDKGWEVVDDGHIYCGQKDKAISAFTVAELGEMLPNKIYKKTDWEIFLERGDDNFIIGYIQETKDGERLDEVVFEDKTEANARAKLLMYLSGNDLLN